MSAWNPYRDIREQADEANRASIREFHDDAMDAWREHDEDERAEALQ
jgi:hypothetical protein